MLSLMTLKTCKWPGLGAVCLSLLLTNCASKEKPIELEPFNFELGENHHSTSDSDNSFSFDSDIEDYSISDHRSFDPTGIHIRFEFDQHTLTPEGQAALDQIIVGMTDDPLARLIVRGHADKQGDSQYNDALSARRAKTIETYLIQNGIDEDRLRAAYFGSRKPVIDANQVSAYRQNRRGDFQINYGPSVFGP